MLPFYLQPSPHANRKAIGFATLFFVLLSAIFHFIAGHFGINGFGLKSLGAPPPPHRVTIMEILRTPPPTPKPRPSPRPTSTPTPLLQATRAPTPAPAIRQRAIRHPSQPKMAQQHKPAAVAALPEHSRGTPEAFDSRAQTSPAPVGNQERRQLLADVNEVPLVSPPPVEARDMIVAAEFEHRVMPRYPALAINARWEGTVIVYLTMGPDGILELHVATSSGYPSLDDAALEAAKESTYRPPEINGKPAIETYRVIYTFSLNGA